MGHLVQEAPPRPLKHTLASLEVSVLAFTLRVLPGLTTNVSSLTNVALLLEYHNLVDGLRYYGDVTRGSTAHCQLLHIAQMLFSNILSARPFAERRPAALPLRLKGLCTSSGGLINATLVLPRQAMSNSAYNAAGAQIMADQTSLLVLGSIWSPPLDEWVRPLLTFSRGQQVSDDGASGLRALVHTYIK